MPTWLTLQALARDRGESVRSTRRFIKRAAIPVYRDGGRIRVKRCDVDAVMEGALMTAAAGQETAAPASLKDMLEDISAEVLNEQKKALSK